MSFSINSIFQTIFGSFGTSRRRLSNRKGASPTENLESRIVPAAVSLGVVDGTTLKLDAQRANDPAGANDTPEMDYNFGLPGDKILVGNWNGPGQGTMAVIVRQPGQNGAPNDGLVHWYFDTNGDATVDNHLAFGLGGDNPVVGDWDGDGKDDIGVTRPSGGVGVTNDGLLNWFLRAPNNPNGFVARKYGFSTDTPVVGNWDGKAGDDLGITRIDANGKMIWMQDWNGDANPERIFEFGVRGDTPVTGDWDANGTDNVGVTRFVQGAVSPTWLLDVNNTPTAEISRVLNTPGSIPIVGDWKVAEVAIDQVPDTSSPQLIGYAVVGQSYSRTFTIRNTGTVNLNLGNISTTNGFTITKRPGSVIGANTADTFTVTVTPTAEGVVSGKITIPTNDANENPLQFNIWGATPAPEITVLSVGSSTTSPLTKGQNTAIDFDQSVQGLTGSIRTIRVRNDGQLPLDISEIRLPVGFATVNAFSPTTLTPRAFVDIQIQISTATAGTKQGRIEILNNDKNEGVFDFPVKGIVNPKTPEITVSVAGVNINDNQTTAISFGQVVQGGSAPTQTFEIRNEGTADLSLSNFSIVGGSFTIVQYPASTIAPGAHTSLVIRMDTGTAGQKSAAVSFKTNDTSEATFNFSVSGVVQVPAAKIVVDGLSANDFGSVEVGTAGPERTFTIRNTGNIPLTISNLKLPVGFEVTSFPNSTVAVNSSTTLKIRMSTKTPGTWNGNVQMTTNDAAHNPFTFSIQGKVTFAEVEVRIKGIPVAEGTVGKLFMGASFGANESRTFEVYNRGTAPLVLQSLTVTGGYQFLDGLGRPLPSTGSNLVVSPGGMITLRVAFQSTTPGVKDGFVRFSTNDMTGNESTVSVALRGKVFQKPTRTTTSLLPHDSSVTITGDVAYLEVQPANGDHAEYNQAYKIVVTYRDGSVLVLPCTSDLRSIRVVGSGPFVYEDWTESIRLNP